mgnify:CR=1 FL=1
MGGEPERPLQRKEVAGKEVSGKEVQEPICFFLRRQWRSSIKKLTLALFEYVGDGSRGDRALRGRVRDARRRASTRSSPPCALEELVEAQQKGYEPGDGEASMNLMPILPIPERLTRVVPGLRRGQHESRPDQIA